MVVNRSWGTEDDRGTMLPMSSFRFWWAVVGSYNGIGDRSMGRGMESD